MPALYSTFLSNIKRRDEGAKTPFIHNFLQKWAIFLENFK